MGSCGDGPNDCGCGGTCSGSATPPGPQALTQASPSTGHASSPDSCGGSCSGTCDDCTERGRVGALNWGRLQADATAGLSEFWRQAIIADTLLRTNGETLPPEVLPALSQLVPAFEITRFPINSAAPAFGGRVPRIPPGSPIGTLHRLNPFFVGTLDSHAPRSEDLWDGMPWAAPSVFRSVETLLGDQYSAIHDPPVLPFWCADAGGAAAPPFAVASDDLYPDPADGDAPECVSLWQNTFYSDGKGSCAIGRVLVGCEQKKPCKKSGEECLINKAKDGCECASRYPPPDSPYECCCCVDDVYVDDSPNPHAWRSLGELGKKRVGQAFKVVAKLKHKGKSGRICKCTMTWSEYANQTYDYKAPDGKMEKRPGNKWNSFSDKKWSEAYGDKKDKDLACADKTVEFSIDEPGPSLPITGGTWEIWIEICVRSCEQADCKCEHKEKCVKLHQVVKQTGNNVASADMQIDRYQDGTQFKGDEVKAPPGGWHSDR